ncbi:MAG: ectonucleotide pyrophosphatase/phosphodiesterase [Pyrinomonadaceae bacterium]
MTKHRRPKKFQFAVLLCIFLSAAAFSQTKIADLKPTVILISIDGMRADYVDRFIPPALTQMAKTGVRAEWMTPSFPTKTFPNHYTIATGLYPANHGIVENNVYDFDTVFTMSKREEVRNPRWWGGEPIWVTATKQGQLAGSYFFVGTEAPIERVNIWKTRYYNGRVPNNMRVDKVLSWLDNPVNDRPTIITLYFSDVDDAGHEFGPDAEETKYAVWEVDSSIERLMQGLKKRGIENKANVIVVSDHGMAKVNVRNTTFLDDHFDFDDTERILWTSEIIQIFPKPGKEESIYAKIKDLPHVSCWKKADIPERLNYRQGKRVAPIVCSSQEGWITTNHKRYEDWIDDLDDLDRPRGAHGYDNAIESMRATFIAHGPAFKSGFVAKPFPNVDVYNVMCEILGLKAAPNDGDLSRVRPMLNEP